MTELLTVENGIALLTLTALEIVLGIDNIVFLTIVVGKLPDEQRAKARQIGLVLAMVMRILLLLAIGWVMGLTKELFSVLEHGVTGKDLIMLVGGLFLIGKATHEIHEKIEGAQVEAIKAKAVPTFRAAIVQVVLLDIVFSLDSVITAVGMAKEIVVMVIAVVAAVGVMLLFAKSISNFVEQHPTLKVLALAFLLLIGVMLVAEGCGKEIEKGYIYFALGFSLAVEMLNIRVHRKKGAAVSSKP
ncbi:MAG: TerC family protein [Planctomycetes bacterium]|nr:TerC family protein [Planctomycetota bacterium]